MWVNICQQWAVWCCVVLQHEVPPGLSGYSTIDAPCCQYDVWGLLWALPCGCGGSVTHQVAYVSCRPPLSEIVRSKLNLNLLDQVIKPKFHQQISFQVAYDPVIVVLQPCHTFSMHMHSWHLLLAWQAVYTTNSLWMIHLPGCHSPGQHVSMWPSKGPCPKL